MGEVSKEQAVAWLEEGAYLRIVDQWGLNGRAIAKELVAVRMLLEGQAAEIAALRELVLATVEAGNAKIDT